MIYAILIAFAITVGTLGLGVYDSSKDIEQNPDIFLRKGESGIHAPDRETTRRAKGDVRKTTRVPAMPQYVDMYLQGKSRTGDEEE